MFGIEKMAISNRTYPDKLQSKSSKKMLSAAQQIRSWMEAHLYIDWHPRSTIVPRPDTWEDDEAFTALTHITFNRFCRVQLRQLKYQYRRRRALSNSIWESEIVRDILQAHDRMSNEERIEKFLRYSSWEPWLHTQDSLVFRWKRRRQMNEQRSLALKNQFKSFCSMLASDHSPHLQKDSEQAKNELQRALVAISWAQKLILNYPVFTEFHNQPLTPADIDYYAIDPTLLRYSGRYDPITDLSLPRMLRISQEQAQERWSDMHIAMDSAFYDDPLSVMEKRRQERRAEAQRNRRSIERQRQVERIENNQLQRLTQERGREVSQQELNQQLRRIAMNRAPRQRAQRRRRHRQNPTRVRRQESINQRETRVARNTRRRERRAWLQTNQRQIEQRPVLSIDRRLHSEIQSDYGIRYEVVFYYNLEGDKVEFSRRQIDGPQLVQSQITGTLFDPNLVRHQEPQIFLESEEEQ